MRRAAHLQQVRVAISPARWSLVPTKLARRPSMRRSISTNGTPRAASSRKGAFSLAGNEVAMISPSTCRPSNRSTSCASAAGFSSEFERKMS